MNDKNKFSTSVHDSYIWNEFYSTHPLDIHFIMFSVEKAFKLNEIDVFCGEQC